MIFGLSTMDVLIAMSVLACLAVLAQIFILTWYAKTLRNSNEEKKGESIQAIKERELFRYKERSA